MTLGGDWGDTRLTLPGGLWRNSFTGAALQREATPDALFNEFPVALLIRERHVIVSVWAPAAKTVELVTPARRIALHPAAPETPGAQGGSWQTEVDESVLDRGFGTRSTRASPCPIRGRSGSRTVFMADRAWWTPHVCAKGTSREALEFAARPLRDAVIYEMHVGTFTPEGTYAGAQRKLAHLARLGVTHLELMPVATFPGKRGWGYDGVDLYAPFPWYGTPQELASFVGACHAAGLGVLLDVVYNHLGPDGNYLGQYGSVLHRQVHDNLGRRHQLRWAAQRRRAPFRDRQCTDVASRLWIRRPASRCGACHLQLRRDACARRNGNCRQGTWRRTRAQFRADRRERSERSAAGALRIARRPRAGRALVRRFSSRHSPVFHRRDATATTRISAD